MADRWVVLEPLDTVMVRDGRAFDGGVQTAAVSVLPTPSTVAGALGAAYGTGPGAARRSPDRRGRDLPERILGPHLAHRVDGTWRGLWPVPRDVVDVGSDMLERLSFAPDDGVRHDLGNEVQTLLDDQGAEGEPVTGWWDGESLTGYLHRGEVELPVSGLPWQVERRVGLSRSEDRQAREGWLYSAEHLRFADDHGLAVRCAGGPGHALATMVNLGGRGRRAEVHEISGLDVPEPPDSFDGGRLLLYLATPAIFPGGGWHPALDRWPGAELVTAAVGPPQVVATATPDRATGSISGGKLMWAVPAGSVYYLRFPSSAEAADAAGWLRDHALDQHRVDDLDLLSTAGFGLAFTGRWEQ